MGRDKEYPLTPQLEANLQVLLERINRFRWRYGRPMVVNSGYRPGKYNEEAHGAKNSSHLTCEAVDFQDPDRTITRYILGNPGILTECDLFMEDPSDTPTWVHLQTRSVMSGRRIFKK